MVLLNNPYEDAHNTSLVKFLVDKFNSIKTEDIKTDDITRIFFLQKINYALNKTSMNSELFAWLNAPPTEKGSWQYMLNSYGINPDASFLLKGAQFAQAVADKTPGSDLLPEKDIYKLMQQRDVLLDKPHSEDIQQFVALSHKIRQLTTEEQKISNVIKRHQQILRLAKDKITAIKGNSKEQSTAYETRELKARRVNNFNYEFKMKGWNDKLIFRIEDRADLDIEQNLHSYPVSNYFGDDAGIFMMRFRAEKESNTDPEYKPVALSQFANQGNLESVAKKLRKKRADFICTEAREYFKQINDFCLKLKEAGTYHPDIKLSNFLVHNNRILVSDRKTFLHGQQQKGTDVRSTVYYAPPQYKKIIDETGKKYLFNASKTSFDMDQFMAYQVGMALKEFLLSTQFDKISDEVWEQDVSTSFRSSDYQIFNFSLLIREMTREEEGNRLSIEQFNQLIPFIIQKPDEFYSQLEKVLPSSKLGVDKEVAQLRGLFAKNKQLNQQELLKQTSALFNTIPENVAKDARTIWFAEKLAIECYEKKSKSYFKKLAQKVDKVVMDNDWNQAPWYRKIIHVMSLGYFQVDHVDITTAKVDVNFKDPHFLSHFSILKFLPASKVASLRSPYLTEFLLAHLKEIDPVEAQNFDLLHSKKKESPQFSSSEFDLSASSGTVVIEQSPLPPVEPTEHHLPGTEESEVVTNNEPKKTSAENLAAGKTNEIKTPLGENKHTLFAQKESPKKPKYPSLHRAKSIMKRGEVWGLFATLPWMKQQFQPESTAESNLNPKV